MFLRRKHTEQASDEDLVALLRNGDRASLGYLWDRYAHLLFGVGMKYLKDTDRSKDNVVELFADLPALLKKHKVERFRPWVHTVMRNRCLQVLRRTEHSNALSEELMQDVAQDEHDAAVLREADLQRLEQAIEQLNDGQRTCIRLFHLERRSYEEVAEKTGYAPDKVRSHLQNGRRNLRIILERHADQSIY
ncbi:MAG: sigma-70 family RNA polymerase sigma factor [Flavobacteriales bacterium]